MNRRIRVRLQWIVGLLGLWSALGIAGRGEEIYLRTSIEEPPEMGKLLIYRLVCGRQTFSFVPPRDWQVGLENATRRLILEAPNREASICLKIGKSGEEQDDAEAVLAQIAHQFPQARVAEQFPSYTSSHKGRGLQVHWLGAGQVAMISRVAWFRTGDETLVFTLTASARRFSTYRPLLGNVLTSFRQVQVASTNPVALQPSVAGLGRR
jgi:hypothetical protein